MVLYLITIYMQIPSVFFKRGSYVIKHQTPFLIKVKSLYSFVAKAYLYSVKLFKSKTLN